MSSEALSWAFKQEGLNSAVKFTLVALCECANYATGEIFPSVAHISQITSQNRKTIIGNIAKLEAAGLVIDTGRRVGATKQIKVYEVAIGTVPKAEQSQKRNSSKNGREQSQKRDTEPSREPSSFIDREKEADFNGLPNWVPADAWQAFIDMRAGLGLRPLTGHTLAYALDELDQLRAAGNDPRAVLDQSTFNEWKGLFEISQTKGRNGKDERDRAPRAAAGRSSTGSAIKRAIELTGGMGSDATSGQGSGNHRTRALPNALRA